MVGLLLPLAMADIQRCQQALPDAAPTAKKSRIPCATARQTHLRYDDYSLWTACLQAQIFALMPTKSVPASFGKVLREYRDRAGLSQEELADAAGLDRTFIGMLERGQRQPTLESLFKIADALQVAPQTLVARTAAERH